MEEEKIDNIAHRRPSRRLVYWLVVLVLLSLILWFLWWLFQRPSHGTVSIAPAVEKTDYADPDHRKRYQGKFFTFTYPYDFNRREEVETVKHPLLERVYLSRSDIEGRKIAFTLQDNSGYAFEEYSSFRMRANDPATYRQEKIEINGLNAVIFTKITSVFEESAFFQNNNRVMSVVVSSPTTQNGLREELVAIFDSFAWISEKSERIQP
ncbi:MAG: hypothetical protein IPJ68_06135 [Candidatus Moraniibacteriota bacterium]|nr:MAG: hypothetical protein IPJ68_06135 [Candidatus Moranbacteria bacterium]